MQGSIQLYSASTRPTATDDVQWMLRQNGSALQITYVHLKHFDRMIFFSFFIDFAIQSMKCTKITKGNIQQGTLTNRCDRI